MNDIITYATRAELDADLNWTEGQVGLVYADSTDANNDFYAKSGASGTGSWALQTTLHDLCSNLVNGAAQPFVDLAQAWAQSDTAPDVGDATSKSAKSWATVAQGVQTMLQPIIDDLDTTTQAAVQGLAVAQTAYDALTIGNRVVGTGGSTSTYARWAKGFDAGVSNDDVTIKTGTIVSGVVIAAALLGTSATSIRARVWQRPLTICGSTNSALDAAPGDANDVLVADSGNLSPAALGFPTMPYNGSGRGVGIVPVADFQVFAGYCYIFDASWLDGSGNLLACGFGTKTVGAAVAQRHAGFYFMNIDSTNWSNHTPLTSLFTFGFAVHTYKSVAAVQSLAAQGGSVKAQAAAPSPLTAWEEQCLQYGGPFGSIKLPGVTTANNGLERIFGLAGQPWSTGLRRGGLGVDFGSRIAEDSLADGSTDINYVATPNPQIRLTATGIATDQTGAVVSGKKLATLFVNGQGAVLPITLQDIVADGGSSIPFGVSRTTSDLAYLLAQFAEFRAYSSDGIVLNNGLIRACYFHDMSADAIQIGSADQTLPKQIDQVLIRKLGQTSGAHGDGVQASTAGPGNISITRSVIYHPGPNSAYNEGTYGSNNAVNFAGYASNANGLWALGNVLVSRNAGFDVGPRGANELITNIANVHNIFGGPDYSEAASFSYTRDHRIGLSDFTTANAKIANYLVWGCKRFTSAGPVPAQIGGKAAVRAGIDGSTAWGLLNFDKSLLDTRMEYLLRMLGQNYGVEILYWNGDLNPAYKLADDITWGK